MFCPTWAMVMFQFHNFKSLCDICCNLLIRTMDQCDFKVVIVVRCRDHDTKGKVCLGAVAEVD